MSNHTRPWPGSKGEEFREKLKKKGKQALQLSSSTLQEGPGRAITSVSSGTTKIQQTYTQQRAITSSLL